MAFKWFSDKFMERALELNVVPEMLGFHRSTIRMYPFITSKGFQDVRKVFIQTSEEDMKLLDYYSKYVHPGMNIVEKAEAIAKAVDKRLAYRRDSDNWGQVEYWARPIEVHERQYDDCDGFSVLITYVLRLLGVAEWEVFTAAGPVYHPNGRKEYHAYTIITDLGTLSVWAVEGSFYHKTSMQELGDVAHTIHNNKRYGNPWWIVNDLTSYSSWPLMRFVK